jgi:uncharacterized protein
MTSPNLSQPLSDDDIKRLDDFLLSDESGEEAMMIDELHGFLTAVLSGSDTVMPSEFFPHIWGEPEFATMEQAQDISSLVLRLYNEIGQSLRDGDFEPLLLERPQEKAEAILIADGWCWGYMRGMKLRVESWQPHLKKISDWMYPISIYGLDHDRKTAELLRPKTLEEHYELVEKLADSAVAIADYFRKHRPSPVQTVTRATPKIGRNDPCPCGSGKKYKKCGGVPDGALH